MEPFDILLVDEDTPSFPAGGARTDLDGDPEIRKARRAVRPPL
jgi:hypothetical protein